MKIYLSGGNSGRIRPENIAGEEVNTMPSYWYMVDSKGDPKPRMEELFERKEKKDACSHQTSE